jgi:hypothetical protein
VARAIPRRPVSTTSIKRKHKQEQHHDSKVKKQLPKRKRQMEQDSDSEDKKPPAMKSTSRKPKKQQDSDSDEQRHIKKKMKVNATKRLIPSGSNRKKSATGNTNPRKRQTHSEFDYGNDNEEMIEMIRKSPHSELDYGTDKQEIIQMIRKSDGSIRKKSPKRKQSPGAIGSLKSSRSPIAPTKKKSPSKKQSPGSIGSSKLSRSPVGPTKKKSSSKKQPPGSIGSSKRSPKSERVDDYVPFEPVQSSLRSRKEAKPQRNTKSLKSETPKSKQKTIKPNPKVRQKTESDSDSSDTASFKKPAKAKKPKKQERNPNIVPKEPKRRTVWADHIQAPKKRKVQDTIEILDSSSSDILEEPTTSNNRGRLKKTQIKKEITSIPGSTDTVASQKKSKQNTKKSKNAQVPMPLDNVARLPALPERFELPDPQEVLDFMKNDISTNRNTPSDQAKKIRLAREFERIAREYQGVGSHPPANPQPMQQDEIPPQQDDTPRAYASIDGLPSLMIDRQKETTIPQDKISSDGEFKESKMPKSKTRTPPSNANNKNTTQKDASSSQKEEQGKTAYDEFLMSVSNRSTEQETAEYLKYNKSSNSRQVKKKELLARKEQIDVDLEKLESSDETYNENEEEEEEEEEEEDKEHEEDDEHEEEEKDEDKDEEDEDDNEVGDEEEEDEEEEDEEEEEEEEEEDKEEHEEDEHEHEEDNEHTSTTPNSLKVRAPTKPQQVSTSNKEPKATKKSKTAKDSVVEAVESVEDSGQQETRVQSGEEKESKNDEPDEKVDKPEDEDNE